METREHGGRAGRGPRVRHEDRTGRGRDGGEGAVGTGLSGPRGKIEVGKQQINTVSHM